MITTPLSTRQHLLRAAEIRLLEVEHELAGLGTITVPAPAREAGLARVLEAFRAHPPGQPAPSTGLSGGAGLDSSGSAAA